MIDKKINFKPVNEATGVYVTLVNLLDIEPPYPRRVDIKELERLPREILPLSRRTFEL